MRVQAEAAHAADLNSMARARYIEQRKVVITQVARVAKANNNQIVTSVESNAKVNVGTALILIELKTCALVFNFD